MPTNRRIFSQDAAVAAGDADAAQGLVLHLDANDEDSIESGGANTGSGSGTWFDIANHDLNVPLADKASDLKLHLNASDTSSYGGSGLVWTDLSGEGHNGAISDTSVSFQTDTRGYFDLDGTDDTITVTHDTDFNPSTSDLTFEVWVQRGDTTNEQTILSKGGGVTGYFLNYTTTSNVGYYFYDYGSTSYVRSGTSVSNGVGEWDHVVVTWDLSAKSFDMYVNGTLSNATQVNATGTPSSTTSDLLISTNDATRGHPHWDGLINVVRIYATKFTASEVAQNYRAGNFLSYDSIYSTDLSANFDPANYTSGTWNDSVGGISGTLSNAVFDKELGNFFSFDGSGDIITMPDNSVFDMTTNTSFEIWIRRNNTDRTFPMDKAQNTPNSYGWQFEFTTSNGYRFQTHNTDNDTVQPQTGSQSTSGLWECVSVTISSSNEVKIYLDGIFKQASTLGGTISTNSSVLTLGHYSLSSSFDLNGQIGDLKFYSAELTSAQVAQNYLATKNDYPNGKNATNYGATFSATTPAYFDLDGSNDYFDVNFTNNAMEEFTISAFVRFVSASPNKYFISDTANGNEYSGTFHLGLSSSGNWILYIGNGSSTQNGSTSVSSAIEANHWTHIVFTCDGINDTVKYYKNGSLSATIFDGTASFIGSHSSGGTFKLGRFGGVSNFYTDMDFGQFKIFNKTLSASEVLAEFNATKTPYPAADFT